jgi:hypothetical protein
MFWKNASASGAFFSNHAGISCRNLSLPGTFPMAKARLKEPVLK